MEYKTLYNGVKLPMLGFGVFRIDDPTQCEQAVCAAISAGYRHIDTASGYFNEEAVGRGIRASGIAREELFVTTKLWVPDVSYDKVRAAFHRSLEQLGLNYLDLYLIHQPYNDYYGAWRAMEELYDEGRIRAIGIDNFTNDRLADFMTFQRIKPMVNLLECNAFYQREAELRYLSEHGIQMEAWSPFASGQSKVFENEILKEISYGHGKTVAQVILRWLLQRGIAALSKTTDPERMMQNLDVFSFMLSDQEMELISSIDTGRSCFPTRDTGEAVESFLKAAMSTP